VNRPWIFDDQDGNVYVVDPASDFTSDLASIPRVFWRIMAPHELGVEAPLAHDWLLWAIRKGIVDLTRADADEIFCALLEREGIRPSRRKLACAAVKLWTKIETGGGGMTRKDIFRLGAAVFGVLAGKGIKAIIKLVLELAIVLVRLGIQSRKMKRWAKVEAVVPEKGEAYGAAVLGHSYQQARVIAIAGDQPGVALPRAVVACAAGVASVSPAAINVQIETPTGQGIEAPLLGFGATDWTGGPVIGVTDSLAQSMGAVQLVDFEVLLR
jgi:hypothetical protein